MTGKYLIYTPVESARDERRFDSAWRKVVETCRSLHRDGLAYNVCFKLAEVRPHVLITASGTAKPRRQPAARAITLPPPVSAERCRDRALEAEWFLPENKERRKDGTAYWRKHQARYEELSQLAEEFLRAEAEYWREMEVISGQRQHFKPGRTGESAYADDEVAA